MLTLTVFAVFALTGAALAQERVALNKDTHITGQLLSASVALGISRGCEAMKVRQVFGLLRAFELRNYARRLGYSDDEINAFINDPVEQERMRDLAWNYMSRQGVVEGEEATYCALGRYEIERKSLSGRLLRDTGSAAE